MSKVILQLGGNVHRMDTGLKLLLEHSDAIMIISSELPVDECLSKLKAAKIPKERFIFDYQAWDTVTNFTMTYPKIRDMGVKELYVVSDLFHIPRVQAICESIYLGRDVVKNYIAHGTDNHKEVIWYDLCRALLWRFTGYLLYDNKTKNDRMPLYDAAAKYIEEHLKDYEV
jgi:hypothetical protein